MKVCLGSDHAGVAYKKEIIKLLISQKINVEDVGAFSTESVYYPDFIHPVADAVEKKDADFGIVLCGSGNGAAMTANKHQKIRCALAWDNELSRLARLHNDANMISIPARFVNLDTALGIVKTFIFTTFDGERHQRRIDKISKIE